MKPKKLRKPGPFGHRGVIFEINKDKSTTWVVQWCHWPYCGMDTKTMPRLIKWLTRANAWIEQEKK